MGIILIYVVAIGGCEAQAAKIVGTGAVSCATFLSDIAGNPIYEREYFSWAQAQLQFFREFCESISKMTSQMLLSIYTNA